MEEPKKHNAASHLSRKLVARRTKTAKRMTTTTALLAEATIVSGQDLDCLRNLLKTFYMNVTGFGGTLDNPDGSFRYARLLASKKGSFVSPVLEGVLMTAARIGRGVGAVEAIYLRLRLGRVCFDSLVRNSHASKNGPRIDLGPGKPTPMERDGRCPGTPSLVRIKGMPCSYSGRASACIGVNIQEWSLDYMFLCPGCRSAVYDLEKKNLKHLLESGEKLKKEQYERMMTNNPLEIDRRWLRRYNQLLEFENEHGHCRVGHSMNKTLRKWTCTQRHRWNMTTLSSTAIELLDDIGFNWNPKKDEWNEGFVSILLSMINLKFYAI